MAVALLTVVNCQYNYASVALVLSAVMVRGFCVTEIMDYIELSAAKSWITQPYTRTEILSVSRPIQIQIQIIFIQHQLKQRCTISKLVLRNLNGLEVI